MAHYSETFKKAVRELYGNQFDNMLETGDTFLGRWLDASSQGEIPLDEILAATDLDKLKEKALLIKRKRELYKQYWQQPGIGIL